MWNSRLNKSQARIKIATRNINNLRYADDTILTTENKDELKNLLMKVKEESERASLKLNIKKTKIMASGPITSLQIDEKQWKQWQTLFSWAPKSLQMVIAAMKLKDACSLEEKLWPTTKVCLVKAMVFPVVMYGCAWTIKKTESQRIDAFELWCWRGHLRVP